MRSVLLPACAALLLVSCSTQASPQTQPTRSEPVDVSFLDGSAADIDELIAGRPAVVNFWAASCVFCRHELPWFEALYQRHPEVAFIGVNMQEPPSTARKYWQSGGYAFPSLLDPNNSLRRRFEVSIQPTTVFLDAAGKLVDRKDGPLREGELEIFVASLLSGNGDQEESLSAEPAPTPTPVSHPSSSPNPDPIPTSDPIETSPVPRSLRSWYQGDVEHLIDLGSIMSGGPAKDGIPALDDPQFTTVNDAEYLEAGDLGILVSINGDTRYYPYKVLNWHEIVNDTVGGEPVFVTYCPLCATGVTYSRRTSQGSDTFGVSGLLAQSNLLMYDRATDSLWNQVTGQAVVGPLTGEQLGFVSSDIVTFGTVQREYPQAQVLSTDTGHIRSYSRDPYAGYEDRQAIMFPVQAEDPRLHNKALVYGVAINGAAKAYPLETLVREQEIADQLGGSALTVSYNPVTEAVTVRDQASGQVIPTLPSFWFAWVAQYPETELYGAGQ